MARVALGDRRGVRALKEAVSFVSHRPRQSDDGEQRLTIERARKAYYDMLERSNKDNEITAWLTYFSETVLTAQQTEQMAIAVLATIPVFVIFLSLQRAINKGFGLSGLK